MDRDVRCPGDRMMTRNETSIIVPGVAAARSPGLATLSARESSTNDPETVPQMARLPLPNRTQVTP